MKFKDLHLIVESLEGGLADTKTIADIANMHKTSIESIQSQLKKGVKVEMEHVDNISAAREIAMDHLTEDPQYYSKLEQAGL